MKSNMNFNKRRITKTLYCVLCLFTTLSMSAFWCYKFSLNDDLSVVDYRKFYQEKEDVLPTISLCFGNPFLKVRLEKYGLNVSSYLDFLSGISFSKEMLNIEYSNVTIDISNYINAYFLSWRNGTNKLYDGKMRKYYKMLTSVSFNGYRLNTFFKCFALDVTKDKDIKLISILVSNKIFPSGTRPFRYKFMTLAHLPQQLLLSTPTVRHAWPVRSNQHIYEMRFRMEDVEILRKRNKRGNTCYENCIAYDDLITKTHKLKTGCNTPYQREINEMPLCTTQEKIRKSHFKLGVVVRNKYSRPCKTMETVRITYEEGELSGTIWGGQGTFWFTLEFTKDSFREIYQTRYYYRTIFENLLIMQCK